MGQKRADSYWSILLAGVVWQVAAGSSSSLPSRHGEAAGGGRDDDEQDALAVEVAQLRDSYHRTEMEDR